MGLGRRTKVRGEGNLDQGGSDRRWEVVGFLIYVF